MLNEEENENRLQLKKGNLARLNGTIVDQTLYNKGSYVYDNNSIFVIDKLSIVFKYNNFNKEILNIVRNYFYGDCIQFNDSIQLTKLKGTDAWDFNFKIKVKNTDFGLLHFGTKFNTEEASLEIENSVFYTMNYICIIKSLGEISKKLGFILQSISHYDLALDSTTDHKQIFCNYYSQSNRICKHLLNKEIKFDKVGRCLISLTGSNSENYGYDIGSTNTGVVCAIYNKSLEIKDRRNKKSYIDKLHRSILSRQEDIIRSEIRISKSSLIRERNYDLFDLLNPENHIDIFFGYSVDNSLAIVPPISAMLCHSFR